MHHSDTATAGTREPPREPEPTPDRRVSKPHPTIRPTFPTDRSIAPRSSHRRWRLTSPRSSATLSGLLIRTRVLSPTSQEYPASTVQILGAEKALFRALKTKGNTPKYGLIFHSSFIGKAHARNKGRISRYLANKCSIASRIDCFSDFQTTAFGRSSRSRSRSAWSFTIRAPLRVRTSP